MSFKMAARIAMSEAMPKCRPVLLEPILKVTVAAPNDATPRIQRLISGRRGQLLGYDARDGWSGWDEVSALMPEAEIADMIVEIRSVTQGVGTFRTEFDHLQELVGRTAERIVEETKKRRRPSARPSQGSEAASRRLLSCARLACILIPWNGSTGDGSHVQQKVRDGGRPGDGHRTVIDPASRKPSWEAGAGVRRSRTLRRLQDLACPVRA